MYKFTHTRYKRKDIFTKAGKDTQKENQSLSVEELKCNAKWLTSVRILCDTDLDLDIFILIGKNLL